MKLSQHVTYVGMQNPSMRVFDIIMETEYGTSYNSYLVKGEKTALIDTVHEKYTPEYIALIEEHIKIQDIDYVIVNHTEPDHSGSLREIIKINPDIKVYGSIAAIKNLGGIMNCEFQSSVVKQDEELDLGNGAVLKFIVAPNLHWPDSIFTYLESDKILFTCDFLGSHFCEPLILDSHLKYVKEYREARKYYFDCIFGPFKKFVLAGLDKIKDLDIDMVCNSHGPVLQELLEETKELYREWSTEVPKEKNIAIFYVTAYEYTKKMADKFQEVFEEQGIPVKSYNIIENDMADLAEEMNSATAVLFGSPTINRDALKPVWDLISMTELINLKNKPALVFGSYGWSGEAVKLLSDRLSGIKYKVFNEGVRCQFSPSPEDYKEIEKVAKEFLDFI